MKNERKSNSADYVCYCQLKEFYRAHVCLLS